MARLTAYTQALIFLIMSGLKGQIEQNLDNFSFLEKPS